MYLLEKYIAPEKAQTTNYELRFELVKGPCGELNMLPYV